MPHLPARVALRASALTLMGILAAGCEDCVQDPVDAGPDASVEPEADAGEPEPTPLPDGGDPPAQDAGPLCDENTEGFGDPCSADPNDPLCGNFFCCQDGVPGCAEGQLLFCFDLGPNDCGGCDELDESVGRVGDACGEFGCGVAQCGDGGVATTCVGDHPPNSCGGCEEILVEAEPGDSCSECMTGVQTCTRDQNDLVCWRGRSSDNACGTCERCIQHHALMDERFSGGYIRTGTIAVIEDIGGEVTQLVFDPLVEGPGANGLPLALVMLTDNEDPLQATAPIITLNPVFAQSNSIDPTLADPVRSFTVPPGTDFSTYTHVVIFENFLLGQTISAGLIMPGAPGTVPTVDGGPVLDDGGVDLDAGIADVALSDGGLDAGVDLDAGLIDAASADAGLRDAAAADADAG